MLRLRFAEFILSEAERLSMTGAIALFASHAEQSTAPTVVYVGRQDRKELRRGQLVPVAVKVFSG